jgi:hypothetical protein
MVKVLQSKKKSIRKCCGVNRFQLIKIASCRADGVAQTVECLPSKCKTLNSVPHTTTNQKKKIASYRHCQVTFYLENKL